MRKLRIGLALLLVSCGGGGSDGGPTTPPPPPPPAAVATVEIAGIPAAPIAVGATASLSAVTRDAQGNALSGRTVTWSSSDPAVATVTAGAVTAVGGGTATITASSEGRSGSATITVIRPVASVEIGGVPSAALQPGATAALSATLRDAQGTALTGRTVTWTSNANAVATVSATGVVTAVARGTAVITAASEGRSATASINVITLPASLTLSYSSSFLLPGDTVRVTVRVLDAGGREITDGGTPTLGVSGSALSIANGVVRGEAVGSGTVTATLGALTRSATLEVAPGGGNRIASLSVIDSAMISELRRLGIPAASIAISNNGQLVLARSYGYADTATKRLALPEHLFRVGSTSKPLTAVAVFKLVQDGLLSLDDRPFTMLSDIPVRPGRTEDPRLANITVRDLLRHSAGWNVNRAVDDTIWAAVWRDRVTDPRQHVSYGRSVPLTNAPATEYAYTNYGYQVLGRVIEKVTGKSYEQSVKDAILTPAGVSAMRLGRTPLAERDPLEVTCYDKLPTRNGLYGTGRHCDVAGEQEYSNSAGSWIGSATDMLRWMSVVDGFGGGRADLLNAATITAMTQRPSYAPTGGYYAQGWQVVGDGAGVRWSHAGAQVGGDGYVVRFPNGVSMVILANLTRGSANGGGTLDVALVPLVRNIASWPTGTSF